MLNIYFSWLSLSFSTLLKLSVGRFDFNQLPKNNSMRSMYFAFATLTALVSAGMLSAAGLAVSSAFSAAVATILLTALLLWGLTYSPFIPLIIMLSAVGDLLRPFAYVVSSDQGIVFLSGLELGWFLVAAFQYLKFIKK